MYACPFFLDFVHICNAVCSSLNEIRIYTQCIHVHVDLWRDLKRFAVWRVKGTLLLTISLWPPNASVLVRVASVYISYLFIYLLANRTRSTPKSIQTIKHTIKTKDKKHIIESSTGWLKIVNHIRIINISY